MVDDLVVPLGIAPQDDPLADVRSLATGGRRIDAIKRYRQTTGAGLRAAKDAVDTMDRGR